MQEQRRGAARYGSIARVTLSGTIMASGRVRDISITGCRTEFEERLALQPEQSVSLRIYPEKASGIGSFGLTGKVVWTAVDGDRCSIGFFLMKSSAPPEFQNYLDFIVYSHGARHGIDPRLE
jgi:hypothetical protein